MRKRATSTQAQTANYMMVFGAQRPFNPPGFAHTFAVFLRVHGDVVKRADPMSWVPTSLKIRFLAPPEPGKNLPLMETLDWLQKIMGARGWICAWGPLEIEHVLYDKALTRIKQLGAGRIQYVVLDGPYRPDRATNCIHALSDLGLTARLLGTGWKRGESASRAVVEYFRRWIINPTTTYPELARQLGLDAYEISPRRLQTRSVRTAERPRET
jgi:hypothetical protein